MIIQIFPTTDFQGLDIVCAEQRGEPVEHLKAWHQRPRPAPAPRPPRSKFTYASEYFQGRNLMTCDVISQRFIGRFAVETSGGGWIGGTRLWGVTVCDRYTGARAKDDDGADLSRCFNDLGSAERFANSLADL